MMRARAAVIVAILGAALPAPAMAADVVVSQVYGGGGNTGATHNADFVELFNRADAPVSIAGWSIQYASATGTGTFQAAALTGSLPPGGRHLVRLGPVGATGAPLPTADGTGNLNLSGSAGKVALVDQATAIPCNGGSDPCTAQERGRIVDLVGYGTANFAEGSPAPGLSNGTAAFRADGGCVDSDDNAADFTSAAPQPRNSATPPHVCDRPAGTGTASPDTLTAGDETTLSVAARGASTSTGLTVTADLRPIGGPAAQRLTDEDGDGTFTVRTTVDPATTAGAKPLVATIADAQGRTGTTTITLAVREACGAPASAIGAVQGTGARSERVGEQLAVEGVVVGDYQQAGGFGGFYVQSATPDDDPATAEGLFVRSTAPVSDGDLVRVHGTVAEQANGASRLTSLVDPSQVTRCDTGGSVEPTVVALPAGSGLERFEGMRVRFTQPLTVTETYTLGRYGEVLLAAGGRLYTPTNVVAPGAAAQALAAENAARSILLDDGDNRQNIDPTRFPEGGLTAQRTLRSGDTVPQLDGVLDDRFGVHRVQPVGSVPFASTNPRPAEPEPVGGALQVASFNVLNYFNGPAFPTPRGATTPSELERQTAKEVAALAGLDADVVGLMELENDAGDDQAVRDLVDAVNAKAGAGTYDYVDTGVVGTDEIRVGLVYKPSVVRPIGEPSILDSSVDPRFIDTLNRPSIAQAFELVSSLEPVTVVVNHLKSKGSDCDDVGDPDTGDGQGNCNRTRTQAARALADWLATDPNGAGTTDALIIGDLNAYAMEDPVRVLREAGYEDQVRRFGGPGAYSYVFDGQAGYLDHALASRSLAPKVRGATDWHINADEPIVMDYNTEFKTANQVDELYAPTPYRSSDHDPVLVGLDLAPTYQGQLAALRRHVTDASVLAGLTDKLEGARAAERRGDAQVEANMLAAYRNQLAAQAGKAVPEDIAAALRSASTRL